MQKTALEIDALSGNAIGQETAPANDHRPGPLDLEEKIRQFVSRNLLFSEDGFPFQNEDSFLHNDVIDSLGVLELVTFATREFGLEIEPAEVTPENFDSVSRLADYIRRKQDSRKEVNGAGS